MLRVNILNRGIDRKVVTISCNWIYNWVQQLYCTEIGRNNGDYTEILDLCLGKITLNRALHEEQSSSARRIFTQLQSK